MRFILSFFAATVLGLLPTHWLEAATTAVPNKDELTFHYNSEQLNALGTVPVPRQQITKEQLGKLIKEVDYLLYTAPLSPMDLTVIPSYLANAQKDFAWLSYLITGQFAGNLAPVTLWTLQLFQPKATLPSVEESNFDVFSSLLAATVVEQVATRLQSDRASNKNYSVKRGTGYWTPTSPGYRGLNFGSMKTWFLDNSTEYIARTPPSDEGFWRQQCGEITQEQQHLDGKKTEAVFDWAGLSAVGAGDWHHLAQSYLDERNVPLTDQLYIRAVLFSALADSNAAAFHSKYTFWVLRPSQRDSSIHPLITIPNHPSYPSAHSTISATAATVLNHFFPDDSALWDELAEESGMSRIWGGIHYPVDHLGGVELGKQVGEAVIKSPQINGSRPTH